MSVNIIDARKDDEFYGELKAGQYFIFELEGETELYVKTDMPVNNDESMKYAIALSCGTYCGLTDRVKVIPVDVEIKYS